jgi:deoxyribodipyrimidine photolyase-related protein
VRGIYWTQMPGYLNATRWTRRKTCPPGTGPATPTWPACATRWQQTLAHGYANHIQRLMVTGLYALMLGVQPRQVHAWYLAVYVDAVEWVELPNTLGMSQYADGGVMAASPTSPPASTSSA